MTRTQKIEQVRGRYLKAVREHKRQEASIQHAKYVQLIKFQLRHEAREDDRDAA